VRAGQHYERLAWSLDAANADSLIAQARSSCPIVRPSGDDWIKLDNASRRFVSLMEGRAINGETLWTQISNAAPPRGLVDQSWFDWFKALYAQSSGPVSPAWQPPRLDYEFKLRQTSTSTSGSLHATSYRNGTLDWDTFVIERTPATAFAAESTLSLTPARARYAGQPMRRWWEFEDGAVDFGALDVAKTDLAKLVIMEFALVFGDDWFVLPLDAAPNSLVRLRNLEVQDCFGLKFKISAGRDLSSDPLRVWQVFSLAAEQRSAVAGDFLYVPPSAGGREESPVLEEVRFARDEGANIVFAIEHTVPNQLGEPMAGFAMHLERLRRRREAAGNTSTSGVTENAENAEGAPLFPPAELEYVLATKVPENWIPYLATDDQNVVAGLAQRSVKLRRGQMLTVDSGAVPPERIAPQSRLLRGLTVVNEEAVGRAGVRVELRRQRTRSAKGETFVWLGRKVGVGKGEARSGLRFDQMQTRSKTP